MAAEGEIGEVVASGSRQAGAADGQTHECMIALTSKKEIKKIVEFQSSGFTMDQAVTCFLKKNILTLLKNLFFKWIFLKNLFQK